MYSSYDEAARLILLALEADTLKILKDHPDRRERLVSLLKMDSAGNLPKIDFLEPDRVLRCLKGSSPLSIVKSVEILFPRSWRYIKEAYVCLNKSAIVLVGLSFLNVLPDLS